MLQRLGKFVFISSFFIVLNLNVTSCRNSGSIIKPTPPPNPSATPENPAAGMKFSENTLQKKT